MMRGRLLSGAMLVATCGGIAHAQVTVPLPQPQGGRTEERPAPPPRPSPPEMLEATPATVSTPPSLPNVGVDINPYDRDIELTVPLTYRDRPLGEVPILLTRDDRFVVETKGFLALVLPLLNQDAQQRLAAQLAGRDQFVSADLGEAGIALQYDPGTLSVVVLSIEPESRATEALFDSARDDEIAADLQPADFSAYLNFNVAQTKIWGEDTRLPSLFLNGAARWGRIVAEADIEFSERQFTGTSNYQFERNYARLVYDEPEDFRRWQIGDLSPEVRGQQGFVQLGGVGVNRQRRRFDPYRSSVLQGNRQFVLQRNATVAVLRNGVPIREFRLEPGSYDVSSLPLLTGSNDVEIQIRDESGRVENIAYRAYLDPIDLAPGDYEYSAYVGSVSNRFGGTPKYGDEIAFTGFFRKAFLDKPAIGIGLQASRRTQTVTGQTQFVIPGGGRLQLDAGASHSRIGGTGFIAAATYEQIFDRGGLIDSLTFRGDYTSRRFATLGTDTPDNQVSYSLGAAYARAFNPKLTFLFDANYFKNRRNDSNRYRVSALASYRFDPKWSVRAGVDYSRFGGAVTGGREGGFGFTLSLVFQPSYRTRAEARHDSSTDTSTLSYTKASDNRLGSVGYGVIVGEQSGTASAQGYADYIANRFDLSVSHTTAGNGFGSLTDEQISTIRFGTTIAFADGAVGVGRRINDSFAILYPHKNLDGRRVVAGQSLARNDYLAKSGALGGAINGYLSSYVAQTVQYDIENPPLGYDVGPGSVRVKPPYRSGYKLRVGTDAFASAMGILHRAGGAPAGLVAGQALALDGQDKEAAAFFTNSAGRFSVMNLRPGVRYRVTLNHGAGTFEFNVPHDTTGLVDLGSISLTPADR